MMKRHEIKRIPTFLVVTAALLLAAPASATEEAVVLTDADVVALSEAGLPASVANPSHTVKTYQYDDGTFEKYKWVSFNGVYPFAAESAQSFSLSSSGTIKWIDVCLTNQRKIFRSTSSDFTVYVRSDSDGQPGSVIHQYESGTRTLRQYESRCFRQADLDVGVSDGDVWVSVEFDDLPDGGSEEIWRSSRDNSFYLLLDESNGGGKRAYRSRTESETYPREWTVDTPERVYGIRLGVDHRPDEQHPEPPADDVAPCNATGSGINLDGHQLFMCIVAGGQTHQLNAEKLSSKVVVFGRLTDPKAVVKMVGGCTWGAVAAVTTARRLQIRVHNTANGKEWVHNHNRGGLAPSAYSHDALCD